MRRKVSQPANNMRPSPYVLELAVEYGCAFELSSQNGPITEDETRRKVTVAMKYSWATA